MMGGRALGAGAIGDAGVRDLAVEWTGPRVGAVLGAGRGQRVGSRAGERWVKPRR